MSNVGREFFKCLLFMFIITSAACDNQNNPSDRVPDPILSPEILSISFLTIDNPTLIEDIKLSYDGDMKHFVGATSNVVSVTDLIASFEIVGDYVEVNGEVQQSGVSEQDFTNIVEYKVFERSSGNSQSYFVDLTLFTGLPVIFMDTEDNQVIESRDSYIKGSLLIEGGRHFNDISSKLIDVRGRGHSTWLYYPKKPYQIRFDNDTSILNLSPSQRWIFLAEYGDKTMLRNKLAFELGYISDLTWTSKSQFAEVFVNKQYEGTYHVVEKIEVHNSRVNIGENEFLIEIDQEDRLDSDDIFFKSSEFLFNIKHPELIFGDDRFTYVENLVNNFEMALLSNDFLDETMGYSQFINVDSFIDWFLINEITKNLDAKGFFSSVYLTVDLDSKINMGPIWDFDWSLAGDPEGWWVKDNIWYARLFQDPIFLSKLKNRFMYFNDRRDYIIEKIELHANRLLLAQEKNNERWGTIGIYVLPNPIFFETYEEEVNFLKSWFNERLDWLENALEQI